MGPSSNAPDATVPFSVMASEDAHRLFQLTDINLTEPRIHLAPSSILTVSRSRFGNRRQ